MVDEERKWVMGNSSDLLIVNATRSKWNKGRKTKGEGGMQNTDEEQKEEADDERKWVMEISSDVKNKSNEKYVE